MHNQDASEGKGMCHSVKCGEGSAIRVLTSVIVVLFVFFCGFRFGEISEAVNSSLGNGYRMMNQGNWTYYDDTVVHPMMQTRTIETAPATQTGTTKK